MDAFTLLLTVDRKVDYLQNHAKLETNINKSDR